MYKLDPNYRPKSRTKTPVSEDADKLDTPRIDSRKKSRKQSSDTQNDSMNNQQLVPFQTSVNFKINTN